MRDFLRGGYITWCARRVGLGLPTRAERRERRAQRDWDHWRNMSATGNGYNYRDR